MQQVVGEGQREDVAHADDPVEEGDGHRGKALPEVDEPVRVLEAVVLAHVDQRLGGWRGPVREHAGCGARRRNTRKCARWAGLTSARDVHGYVTNRIR